MLSIIKEMTDAQQIIRVIHAAFKRYELDSMPSSALKETEVTIEQELKDGVLMFGAEIGEQLVGVVKLSHDKDQFYFSRLAVLPEFQGRGVASALVTFIEKLAVKEQIPTVRCKVRKSEQDNIRLYKKLGFHISKEEITMSPLGFTMGIVTMDKEVK